MSRVVMGKLNRFLPGFYEWKSPDGKKGGPKQPYFVYAAQEEGRDVLSMSECTAENGYSEQNGWIGPKPLLMAGIFSYWHRDSESGAAAAAKREDDSAEEEPVVYSYSVITRAANSVTKWLHDRVPAILPDAGSVQKWLDAEVDSEEAIKNLQPVKKGQVREIIPSHLENTQFDHQFFIAALLARGDA